MRKLTNEEFLKRVLESGDGKFIPLSEYINQRTKVKVRHSCGYEWESQADTLMRKPGCPICAGNIKKTTKQYKNEVTALVGEEYKVIGEYTGNKNKIKFHHLKCGNYFWMEAKAFLLGQRCPICKKTNLSQRFRKTHDIFLKEVFNQVGNEYEVLTEYQSKNISVKMKHNRCQTVFDVTPNHFLSSMESRCPYCKSSKGEKSIERFLIENGLEFKKQYRINNCKNKRPLPFDFAIFNNGELKTLIEYDGIQHFLPKWGLKEFERTKKNDEIKNRYCEANKIPLVRIPYTTDDIETALVEILYCKVIPSQAVFERNGRCRD